MLLGFAASSGAKPTRPVLSGEPRTSPAAGRPTLAASYGAATRPDPPTRMPPHRQIAPMKSRPGLYFTSIDASRPAAKCRSTPGRAIRQSSVRRTPACAGDKHAATASARRREKSSMTRGKHRPRFRGGAGQRQPGRCRGAPSSRSCRCGAGLRMAGSAEASSGERSGAISSTPRATR